jgi:hypothetical protein
MLSHCVAGARKARHGRTFTASAFRACNPIMETTTLKKNRPRSQPTPNGKRTAITDNDIFGIFEPLSRHAHLEPDALFAIGEHYFALEADMGTESIQAVIKAKIRAYRQIVATGTIDDHFGIDNLAVLFVTTNEKRMRNMMKAVESIARNGRSTMFGFACRPDLVGFMRAGPGRPDVPETVAQGRPCGLAVGLVYGIDGRSTAGELPSRWPPRL